MNKPMTFTDWETKYQKMMKMADLIRDNRMTRARRLCDEAGLDSRLLGIHPHNAMNALRRGEPWKGVDYQKVRECLYVSSTAHDAYRIVERWDRRVRITNDQFDYTK